MSDVNDWRAPDRGTITKMPDGTPRSLADIGVQAGACALHFKLEHIKSQAASAQAQAASAQALDNGMLAIVLGVALIPVAFALAHTLIQ